MRGALSLALVACCVFFMAAQHAPGNHSLPGSRTVMDAHNCYPYYEWWYDRIDRALSAGTPLAIEQDLYWHTDAKTGKSWSIVAHGVPISGQEPTMQHYFFDRVRPVVERALKEGNHGDWPVITLNLDFKTEEPEHLQAVWALLTKYQDWLTTAQKTGDPNAVQPLVVRPIRVLTGESDAQQKVFFDDVPVGKQLLVFGAVHTNTRNPMAAPEVLEPNAATNYRRWWNNAWSVVEAGGQQHAGDWTPADDERLRQLVQHAHSQGLWIRFYTLDGATEKEESCNGWFRSYNFGSLAAARVRWNAAQKAGVDYIASDQYERLGEFLRGASRTKVQR
jgi:glycerophosphoryl diester phosphodiesterase